MTDMTDMAGTTGTTDGHGKAWHGNMHVPYVPNSGALGVLASKHTCLHVPRSVAIGPTLHLAGFAAWCCVTPNFSIPKTAFARAGEMMLNSYENKV